MTEMPNSQLFSEERQSNSSTIQSKEPIFRIKKLQRKGLLEKKSMVHNKTFVAGKWTTNEKIAFINSCYKHGPHWKKIKRDIHSRTIGQIRSHAHKYMIRLCKKYGIQVINKKHKRFIRKNTNHLIQKKKESKWKNIDDLTKEEMKFLKEFNFYIKKYDERLYKLLFAEEILFEEKKQKMQKKAEDIKNYITTLLGDVVNDNYASIQKLFC